MFPAIAGICDENIIEDHCAQPDQDQLSHIPNTKSRVKTIGFQRLPMRAILISERCHIVAKNVAQEAKLETLVQRVGGDNHVLVGLKNQNLASVRVTVELKEREYESQAGQSPDQDENRAHRIGCRARPGASAVERDQAATSVTQRN